MKIERVSASPRKVGMAQLTARIMSRNQFMERVKTTLDYIGSQLHNVNCCELIMDHNGFSLDKLPEARQALERLKSPAPILHDIETLGRALDALSQEADQKCRGYTRMMEFILAATVEYAKLHEVAALQALAKSYFNKAETVQIMTLDQFTKSVKPSLGHIDHMLCNACFVESTLDGFSLDRNPEAEQALKLLKSQVPTLENIETFGRAMNALRSEADHKCSGQTRIKEFILAAQLEYVKLHETAALLALADSRKK